MRRKMELIEKYYAEGRTWDALLILAPLFLNAIRELAIRHRIDPSSSGESLIEKFAEAGIIDSDRVEHYKRTASISNKVLGILLEGKDKEKDWGDIGEAVRTIRELVDRLRLASDIVLGKKFWDILRDETQRAARYSYFFSLVMLEFVVPKVRESLRLYAADTIRSVIRSTDVIGRIRRKKLAIIFHHAEAGNAEAIIERIRERLLANPNLSQEGVNAENIRFEVASFQATASSPEDLLRGFQLWEEGEDDDDDDEEGPGPAPVGVRI